MLSRDENAGWEPGIHPNTTASYGYFLNDEVECLSCAILHVDWIRIFPLVLLPARRWRLYTVSASLLFGTVLRILLNY
jgi:hypothetical protein